MTDRHSRLVGLAKVLLPLAALALLSSLVLLSEEAGPAVPAGGSGERRIGAPDLAGVTEDGARISVTARLARPEGAGTLAEGLSARIDEPERSSTVEGETGEVDEARTRLDLTEGRLSTSGGYEVAAPVMRVDLTRTLVTGSGGVEGSYPGGRVTSREMRMDGSTLTFTGAVRLLYRAEP